MCLSGVYRAVCFWLHCFQTEDKKGPLSAKAGVKESWGVNPQAIDMLPHIMAARLDSVTDLDICLIHSL